MYSLLQVNVGRVLCLFPLSLVIMMGNVAGIHSSTSYLQNSFSTYYNYNSNIAVILTLSMKQMKELERAQFANIFCPVL